jgi:hypothetical protein
LQLTSIELNEIGQDLNFASSHGPRVPSVINCAHQVTYSGIVAGSPTGSTRRINDFCLSGGVDEIKTVYLRDSSARSLASSSSVTDPHGPISVEESAEIIKAILEADELEERKSLALAMQLQNEEIAPIIPSIRKNQGNVRTMTRAELKDEQNIWRNSKFVSYPRSYEKPDRLSDNNEQLSRGFRMNGVNQGHLTTSWRRLDQNTAVGPNNEICTKHDKLLSGYSKVERLGLETDEFPVLGNKAYNS